MSLIRIEPGRRRFARRIFGCRECGQPGGYTEC